MVRYLPPLLVISTAITTGCKKDIPPANPEFSDAVVFAFSSFETTEADLAFAIRSLEEQIYLSMDVGANKAADRALLPSALTQEDIDPFEEKNEAANIKLALPVAVAGLSGHTIDQHRAIQMLKDHTPVEPYSPDLYTREWIEGKDCWEDRSCDFMRTENDLTKDNILMTVDYWFYKDFRWVDLNLPDPAEVPEGEEPVNDGDPRWAYAARSWTTKPFPGRNGKAEIVQSYTIEVWIPRDGGGYIRKGSDKNADGGDWTNDSKGGNGVLRMLCLWAETDIGIASVTDEAVVKTTRDGIDKNFRAAQDWLDDKFGERSIPDVD